MLGLNYRYLVVVTNEYASDDESYENINGFNDINDALFHMDCISQDEGISICLYEHKFAAYF